MLAVCAAAFAAVPAAPQTPAVGQAPAPREWSTEGELADATRALLIDLAGAQVGVLAVDLETGRVLAEHQATARFVPASNQKILTTAAALSIRGPDFRFVTELRAPVSAGLAPVSAGTVRGDLVVCGSGDPTWSRRFNDGELGSRSSPLDRLAADLAGAGVRSIDGRLIIDAARWDSARAPGSWMTGDLAWGYAATGGVVSIDEGSFEVVVDGRTPGHHAAVSAMPERWASRIESHVDVVGLRDSARVRVRPLPGRRWSIEGLVRRGIVDTLTLAVPDPVADAGRALAGSLASRDIVVRGGTLVDWSGAAAGDTCRNGAILAATESAPLIEVARAILEPSQNWIAEQVVRSLAEPGSEFGPPGSRSGGLARMESELADVFGVDTARVDSRDGSGLSAYNLVTPEALVQVLRSVARTPWGMAYRAALAEPGEVGSTLDDRLGGLEGRLFAKTGTITHVNSLSGYLIRGDGSPVVFSVLTNVSGRSSGTVRRAIDRWVHALAEG